MDSHWGLAARSIQITTLFAMASTQRIVKVASMPSKVGLSHFKENLALCILHSIRLLEFGMFKEFLSLRYDFCLHF